MNRFYALEIGTILIFALNARAQQPASAPGSSGKSEQAQPSTQDDVPTAGDQLKVLTSKLDLTDDQQATIKPILEGLHDATVKISEDHNLSREERLAKVRPLRYKAHDQILAILNDEQKKKFEQYMQGPHAEVHGKLSGEASSPQPQKN
jgi:Spy/CpxP family protein refolding chaperone